MDDIKQPLYRWNNRGPEYIFKTGFKARDKESTSIKDYLDLRSFVTKSGAPLKSERSPSTFVSTTSRRSYKPYSFAAMYKYTIHAPGGILVYDTLKDNYGHLEFIHKQKEIVFSGGISRCYIKSAVKYNSRL